MEKSASCYDCALISTVELGHGQHHVLHKPDLFSAHSLPMTEHSSDKSSQDRLSQLDAKTGVGSDGMDWSVAAAPVSSKLQAMVPTAATAATTELQEPAVRTSPRRVRLKLPLEPENSCDSSKRNNSSTSDPAGRLEEGRLQEALSKKRSNPAIVAQALAKVNGETAEERAKCARQLAETLAAEADLKTKRAAHLIAVAQRMATEATRAAKRRRISHAPAPKLGAPDNLLLGTRVAVYWSDDKTFYKGLVVDEDEEQQLHKVVYDDEAEEWLSLADERFRLLTPRATSAGCNSELIRELEMLQAEELAPSPTPLHKRGSVALAAAVAQPSGEAALGWRVSVLCRADGREFEAQVVGYKPAAGLHHLLYLDGEDEWVNLGEEALQWLELVRTPLPAGLPSGMAPPSGQQAIGWRIAVYWKTDQTFYAGTIQAFDATMSRHHLVYNDGDEEHLHLACEHVKWLSPPSQGPKPAQAARAPQGACRAGLMKMQSQEMPFEGAGRDAKRSPARTASIRRPRSFNRLSRHSSRGSNGRNGSMESVRAMLERVDADEAALMSELDSTMLPMSLQPGSHHLFVPAPGASPLADSLEGGSTTLPQTPRGSTVSPTQTSTLLPFKAAEPAPRDSQGWGGEAGLLGWNLGGSPLRGSRMSLKQHPEAGAKVSLGFESSEPAKASCAFSTGTEHNGGLPTAPSPAPQLDSVLPMTFSAEASLLLPEHATSALTPQLGDAAATSEDMPSGDFLDILMDIPGVETAPTAWWQTM